MIDYDTLPGLRWSRLAQMRRSPKHAQTPIDDTPSMALGRLVHLATLEPEEFARTVVVYGGRRQGKAWDNFRDECEALGQQCVTRSEYDQAQAIASAVWSHGPAVDALAGTDREVVCQWQGVGRGRGVACKAKLDAIGGGKLVELKTARNVDPNKFPWVYEGYGYHGQAAWYTSGAHAHGHSVERRICIAVENHAPYDVVCYELSPETVKAGEELAAALFARWVECADANEWPGYAPRGYVPLEIPSVGADWDLPEGEES